MNEWFVLGVAVALVLIVLATSGVAVAVMDDDGSSVVEHGELSGVGILLDQPFQCQGDVEGQEFLTAEVAEDEPVTGTAE